MKKFLIFCTIFLFFPAYSSRKRKPERVVVIDNNSNDWKKKVLEEYVTEHDVTENLDFLFGTPQQSVSWELTEKEFDEAESSLEKKREQEKEESERDAENNKIIRINSSDTNKLILLQYMMSKNLSEQPGHIFGEKGKRISWKLTDEEFEDVRDFLNQESDAEEQEKSDHDETDPTSP